MADEKTRDAESPEKRDDSAEAIRAGAAMPEVTFTTFILSLGSSALVHLGEVPDPVSGRTEIQLPIAKHTIDVLSMLRDKTACSRDEEESKLLDTLLYELRMKYVLKKG
jgi:hypothetical protein